MEEVIRNTYAKHKVGQAKLYQIIKKNHPKLPITLAKIADFYKNNVVEQRYHVPNKVKEHTHFIADYPNDIHQIDLVKMDKDKGHDHFIVVIDVFSRYAAARPLKTKSSTNVSRTIASIYDTDEYLASPNTVMLDQGKEFMGETTKMFKDRNVRIMMNVSTDKRFTSVVERMNKTIETPLFKAQAEEELSKPTQSDTVKPVIKWVDSLAEFIDSYNDTPHGLFGKTDKGVSLTPREAMQHPELVTYNFPLIEDNRPTFQVGTYVKLPFSGDSRAPTRHMMERYSNRIYVVMRVKPATLFQPARYTIADIDTLTILPMSYYRDELIPVNKPDDIGEASQSAPTKLPRRRTTREIEEELYEEPEEEPEPVQPTKTNRRGRKITLPARFRE